MISWIVCRWYRLTHYNYLRAIKFWWQRRTRGWSDDQTWNLDCEIAKFILPRLIRFKQLNNGYSPELTPERWDARIDEMVFAFEHFASEKQYQFDISEEEYERVKRGLLLFAEHYGHLWW